MAAKKAKKPIAKARESKKKSSVVKAEAPETPDDDFFESKDEPTVDRSTVAPKNDRFKALAAVAKQFNGAKPAREVLSVVRAMPTLFVQLDHATRVGGLPIERVMTAHGPSNHGKTLMAAGLGISFLRNDSFFHLIDAERTTPITWMEQLYPGISEHPGFTADRPETYEEAVANVRQWATAIGEAKAKGRIPAHTTGLAVVDSVRKLVPQNFFAKIAKDQDDKGSVDGFGGRAAQMKAALNAAWLDELVGLLEQTGTAMLFITREDEQTEGTGMFAKKVVKVGGGRALIYDASLVIRIEREKWLTIGKREEKNEKIIGERHRVTITKTKVGGKDGKTTVCHFHSSNGTITPTGFDRARDVLDLAMRFEVVQSKGTWLSFQGSRWQGVPQALVKMNDNPAITDAMEIACREEFATAKQIEFDEDGVVRGEAPPGPKDDMEAVFGTPGGAS